MARKLMAAVALSVVLAGCGSPGSERSRPAPVRLTSAQLHTLAVADNVFAGALYGELASNRGNLVLSPASVALALQMAYAGARGSTASAMATALHLGNIPPAAVAAAAGRFAAELAPLANDKRELLRLANTVWVQSGLRLRAEYEAALRGGFGAGLQRTDFRADPDTAQRAINAAIARETNGRIKDLIPPGLIDNTMRLVLTNAVYLNAQWATPFDANETMPGPFHPVGGAVVTVPMMHRTATFDYSRGRGYQALRMPYRGGRLAMTVVLPDGPLAPLEQRLRADGIGTVLSGLQPTDVTLAVPKFRFTWSADLRGPLAALGMGPAFSDGADFTGITTAEPLHIAFVQHKAFIAVDEKGTEAAAATAVGISGSAMRVVPPAAVTMTLDRPFFFVITDARTGLPIFLGHVVDPSGS